MAREKYQTLTEQMFYILLCLTREQCGVDIMERVREMTEGRVVIGPGTLYSLLESFQQEGFIRETKVEGRRRSYRITPRGHSRSPMSRNPLRQVATSPAGKITSSPPRDRCRIASRMPETFPAAFASNGSTLMK